MKLQIESQDGDHQWRPPAHPVSHPARCDRTDEAHPQGQCTDQRNPGERCVKFLGDGNNEDQEHGEIESIEGPAKPRCNVRTIGPWWAPSTIERSPQSLWLLPFVVPPAVRREVNAWARDVTYT